MNTTSFLELIHTHTRLVYSYGLFVALYGFVPKERSKLKDHGKQRGIRHDMQMRFLFLHPHGSSQEAEFCLSSERRAKVNLQAIEGLESDS